ncbi:MAG TPA: hypothetical protein VH561_10845 [Micromonosporaceae bacterium]
MASTKGMTARVRRRYRMGWREDVVANAYRPWSSFWTLNLVLGGLIAAGFFIVTRANALTAGDALGECVVVAGMWTVGKLLERLISQALVRRPAPPERKRLWATIQVRTGAFQVVLESAYLTAEVLVLSESLGISRHEAYQRCREMPAVLVSGVASEDAYELVRRLEAVHRKWNQSLKAAVTSTAGTTGPSGATLGAGLGAYERVDDHTLRRR